MPDYVLEAFIKKSQMVSAKFSSEPGMGVCRLNG